MKRISLLFVFSAIITYFGISQGCLPEGITFTTQTQIDSFPINYPGCTEIEGNVTIEGANITSLQGLSVLTSIGESFSIGFTQLNDLSGLEGLNSVGEHLNIYYNDSMENVTALNNLTTIGGAIQIGSNMTLSNLSGFNNLVVIGGLRVHDIPIKDFTGLESLTSIQGSLTFFECPLLISLNGLYSLDSISEDLTVGSILWGGNPSLEYLIGLENLTCIGGSLRLESNESLTNLTGLENLNTVGNIEICDNNALTNLHGLENITEISGDLLIGLEGLFFSPRGNLLLEDLGGLENLTSIGGKLVIADNPQIESISSLQNLTSIGGDFMFANPNITNLSGLENLTEVGGSLSIGFYYTDWMSGCFCGNPQLENISALSNLTTVGENMDVVANDSLINLNGLENLNFIVGDINIGQGDIYNSGSYSGGNFSLLNLSGLENVDSIGGSLNIAFNHGLTDLSGLNSLAQVGEGVDIIHNLSLADFNGLNNLNHIEGSLKIGSTNTNASGNSSLISLSGLENLSFVGNSVEIINNDALENFQGINNLDSIGGNLHVWGNHSLTDFSGLDNLIRINGDVHISGNQVLPNLIGLNSLTQINGSLIVGDFAHYTLDPGNPLLEDLEGLNNLNSIGGDLKISKNDNLENLSGLDSVEGASIQDLSIYNNSLLNECDVQSICDYLSAPNGTVEIYNNAPGCNSPEEVQEACDTITGLEMTNKIPEFKIYPSPVNDFATLQFRSDQPCNGLIEIFNTTGVHIQSRQLKMEKAGQQHLVLDCTALPAGIYLCRIKVGNEIVSAKIVKQ